MLNRGDEGYVDYRQFLRSLALFRGTLGFMSGMYLFLFGPIVNDALMAARSVVGGTNQAMPFGWDPLQWTAILFAAGIFLEFALEIPTGVFADVLGRKIAIVTSMVFRFANLTLMFLLIILQKTNPVLGPVGVIWIVAVYWVCYSLFFSLQSGAYEAWVKAFLKEKDLKHTQAWVFAHGENWNNALFLVGAIIGIFLWTYGVPHLAYLGGMGVSVLCAAACALYMPENRRVDIRVRPEEQRGWAEVFWASLDELRNFDLVVVFFMNAAVTSLTYLINLALFIFLKNHFFAPENDPSADSTVLLPSVDLRWWSVGATFVLALTTLLGNLVFTRWLRRRLQWKEGLSIRALVWLNTVFNLLLAAPVLAASVIFGNPRAAHGREFLVILIGLMVIHKVAASTYRVAMMTLQNNLIPDGKKETATIISLGATMKNVVIVFLIVLGVGSEPASLAEWKWPALIVLVTTVALAALVRGPASRVEEKSLSGV
jgi:MFS family permease